MGAPAARYAPPLNRFVKICHMPLRGANNILPLSWKEREGQMEMILQLFAIEFINSIAWSIFLVVRFELISPV